MAVHSDRGVPLSTLCPKFLHTNSTSHTSPFSAIAELIDNAYDPDVSAKQFWIDKSEIKGQECLTFMDNGNGLDYDSMHRMLSFGYSDKTTINGVAPIGIYGNGFKSGSMRLGKDAIVFSKSDTTSCVGMLSQTYLKEINADQIIVPLVCFDQTESRSEEHKASLRDILQYSPFSTQEELRTELSAITPPWSTGKTGTRIIIWNLRRKSNEQLELDFERDRYDIRMPSDVYEIASDIPQQPYRVSSYIPESVYSLRAYCSILYLKPRMQIMIRGQKVNSQLIAKSLANRRTDHYRPTFLGKRIPIIFGYNTKSKDLYGMMMYHKNRLIKAYEHVGCQNKANNQGVGVIGVIECNFLNPTHNKQSFDDTDQYRKTMNNLGIKLEEYWKEIRHQWKKENPNTTTSVEDAMKRPDQNWVQCDECLKWRKLPDGVDISMLPEKWFCRMNTDPLYRSCQVDEEHEDSDGDQPSYSKPYRQQEREAKKQQELKRQKEEADQRRLEEQKVANLSRTALSPRTPTTPQRQFKTNPLTPSTISQAADCSPSTSSGHLVILNVCSMAAGPPGRKRTQPVTPQAPPKRSRENGSQRNISDTFSSVDVNPSEPVIKVEDDDTDDDVSILESVSTLRSDNQGFSLTKVKTEKDAAVDSAPETSAVETSSTGASPSPAPRTALTTTATTQTMVPKIKEENQIIVITGISSNEQRQNNPENGVDTPSEKHTLQNGVDALSRQTEELEEVNSLRRELEQRIKENDQLRSQLDSVKKERANLATQCEELRLSLQQHRENAQEGGTTPQRTTNLSVQTGPEEAEGTTPSGTHSSSDTFRSLIELRRNVARLLVTRMPALDLDQVNYECNVIDEILEQVCAVEFGRTVEQAVDLTD